MKILDKKALIIGGTSGIGLAIAVKLNEYGYKEIIILGKNKPRCNLTENIIFYEFDITRNCVEDLLKFKDIETLIITVGIGRIIEFNKISNTEIEKVFNTNCISIIKILTLFANKLLLDKHFFCCVVTSISGLVSSPLFSVYSASKASLCKYIEAVNVELEKSGSKNIITNVAPGYIKNTSFYGGETNILALLNIAENILKAMYSREKMYIPNFNNIYKNVLERYSKNPDKFGLESYDYKKRRCSDKSLIKIGYLSGTFDLFHIGHLNLLLKAKKYCDYLVVGVHKDASHKGKITFIPFEERKKIVASIGVVDKVIDSFSEDSDAYNYIKFDYLFVGSDYKGSERFKKYEKYFENKDVKIIYFPYTQSTSSTQLRDALLKLSDN